MSREVPAGTLCQETWSATLVMQADTGTLVRELPAVTGAVETAPVPTARPNTNVVPSGDQAKSLIVPGKLPLPGPTAVTEAPAVVIVDTAPPVTNAIRAPSGENAGRSPGCRATGVVDPFGRNHTHGTPMVGPLSATLTNAMSPLTDMVGSRFDPAGWGSGSGGSSPAAAMDSICCVAPSVRVNRTPVPSGVNDVSVSTAVAGLLR